MTPDDTVNCPQCSVPARAGDICLGLLGNLAHLCCRDCGWQWSSYCWTKEDKDPCEDRIANY